MATQPKNTQKLAAWVILILYKSIRIRYFFDGNLTQQIQQSKNMNKSGFFKTISYSVLASSLLVTATVPAQATIIKGIYGLAEEGSATAQYQLGSMYAKGDGVTKDSVEARRWLVKSAIQGNAKAQYELGVMFTTGEGGEQDQRKAMLLFINSAHQGDKEAQHIIGSLLYTGIGSKQDFKEAFSWFQKAADQNHPDAQFSLGVMYYEGNGVEQDYDKAAMLFEKAAAQGFADAQYSLGVMYQNNLVTPNNGMDAREWFRLSCENGSLEGCEALALSKELQDSK